MVVLSPRDSPEQLCEALKRHGLSVVLVQDVQSAYRMLKAHMSAFLLLDLSLENAISFLTKAIDTLYGPLPYILATNIFSCSLELAEILNLGADACLERPLDPEEVLAVIKAVLRRADRLNHSKPVCSNSCVEQEGLQIDLLCRSVNIDGRAVNLTVKEFEILHLLFRHPGMVFSKKQIYEQVWNNDYQFATTSVSDHISSLRKKLGLHAKDGRYIQTVHGVGYRFVDPK